MGKDFLVSKIKYVISGVVILAFWACLADKLRLFGVAPNIVLCYVMCVSFRNHDSFGFYNALILGLAADALLGLALRAVARLHRLAFFHQHDILLASLFQHFQRSKNTGRARAHDHDIRLHNSLPPLHTKTPAEPFALRVIHNITCLPD